MWIRIFVLIIFTAKLATSEHQTISQFDKVYLDQSINFLETKKTTLQLNSLFILLISVLFHFQSTSYVPITIVLSIAFNVGPSVQICVN